MIERKKPNGGSGRSMVALGIGEIVWDMLPSGKQLGGAPSNFAWHSKSLGCVGAVGSCVGDDSLGDEIVDRLGAMGLDHSAVAVDPRAPTGTVEVSLTASGQPTFTIARDVAWDRIPCTTALLNLARRADVICFGSLAQRSEVSRKTIRACLTAARPKCIRIFDVNLRQRFYSAEILADSLQLTDVLKLNDEELPVVCRLLGLPGEERECISALIERGRLDLLVITRGGEGATLATADDRVTVASKIVDVVDTVGAGDAFTAAVAVGLLARLDLESIGDHAQRLAGYVCSRDGATPEAPPSFRMLDRC